MTTGAPNLPKPAMSSQAAQTLSEWLLVLMTAIPIAIVAGPTTEDNYAMAGAALAACVSGLFALSKRKPFLSVAMVVISSGAVGTLGPGTFLTALGVIAPDFTKHLQDTVMTWHIYASAGLFFGLGGWAVIHAIMSHWDNQSGGLVGRVFEMFFGKRKQDRQEANNERDLDIY